jgi:hypothetical protein
MPELIRCSAVRADRKVRAVPSRRRRTFLPFSPFGTGGPGKTVNPNLVLPNACKRQGLEPLFLRQLVNRTARQTPETLPIQGNSGPSASVAVIMDAPKKYHLV